MNEITNPQAFIFLGRSGCGKGTQVNLLKDYLHKTNPDSKILHIESGALLREFATGETYTEKETKHVIENGLLVPEAIIVSLWMRYLINNFTGQESLFFDGTPRKLREAQLLDDALKFYKIRNPAIICVNVSRDWAEKRLLGRARKDDTKESINKRLDWYETEVMAAINFFKSSSYYKAVDINGEQPIEDVQKEILAKLGLNI